MPRCGTAAAVAPSLPARPAACAQIGVRSGPAPRPAGGPLAAATVPRFASAVPATSISASSCRRGLGSPSGGQHLDPVVGDTGCATRTSTRAAVEARPLGTSRAAAGVGSTPGAHQPVPRCMSDAARELAARSTTPDCARVAGRQEASAPAVAQRTRHRRAQAGHACACVERRGGPASPRTPSVPNMPAVRIRNHRPPLPGSRLICGGHDARHLDARTACGPGRPAISNASRRPALRAALRSSTAATSSGSRGRR